MEKYADQLNSDVLELQKRISELAFPPSKVVGGAAGLIEKSQPARSAAKKIVTATPTCGTSRPTLTAHRKSSTCCVRSYKKRTARCWRKWTPTLRKWTASLSKYRTKDGFETYDKLTTADRNALKGPITTLAEDLAQLRGILGLDLSRWHNRNPTT